MAIFDTIRESIGVAGQRTADIAKKTAEAIRLRDQIRRDKKDIRQLTYKIGETYLRLHGDQCEDVYREFVDGITAAKADMDEKKAQLAQLREKSDAADADVTDDVLDADDDDWDTFFEESTSENQPEAEEEAPTEEITEAAEEVTEATEEVAEEVEAAEEVTETAEEPSDIVEE